MANFRDPNRESSYMRNMDAAALDIASQTRNSTQYSQGSVTSWVQSYHQNPPGAPPSDTFASPIRNPRPLPNPQLYTTNPTETLDEDEEYMNIDANVPDLVSGYRNEGLGRARKPVPTFDPSDSGVPEEEVAVSGGSKSFVGGFVSGLKRFPRAILRYGDRKKPTRKGTYGTDATATSGTGNTLPRYASNPPTPVAGPSGVRYTETAPMPVPEEVMPPMAPSGHHRQFSMRVTPPSEQAGLEDEAQPYDPENPPPPQFSDASRDRPITQVEFDESELAHSVQMYHDPRESITSPPARTQTLPHPSPHPNQLPLGDEETITQQPGAQTSPSAVLARPHPASDYMRMSHPTTHPTTLTTITSTSLTSGEPSFSSELHPVHRFFHTLRKMPWVATERVTVDYRPGPGRSGKTGPMNAKVAKKSLVSWYQFRRSRISGASTVDLDLMSSGTAGTPSRRTRTSAATPVASPTTRRIRSRHNLHHHQHHTHRRRHNRHRRRDTVSTAPTESQTPRRRQMSPILPPVYPYPYPYTYGYPTYPAPNSPPRPQHHRRRNDSLPPRGPRSPPYPNRTPSYPLGYAPYQPPPPPPPPPAPVYVLQAPSSGSPRSNEGGQSQTTGQLLSPVYMQMQMVPGSFYQDGAAASNSPPNPNSNPNPSPNRNPA